MIVQSRSRQNGAGELKHSADGFAPVRSPLGAVTGTLLAGMFAILIAPAGSAQANDLGTWLTTDRKAKVELRECGGTGLCSEIVWLKEPVDENGKPWRDILNQDTTKRGRPIIGMDILEGLKKVGPKTWSGNIYDPEKGKAYYLKFIKLQRDKVEIRGCMSSGWPCRTKYWTRSAPVRPPATTIQVAKPRPVPQLPPPRTATVAPPQPRTATVAPPQPRTATVAPAQQRTATVAPRQLTPAPVAAPAVSVPQRRPAVQQPVQRQAAVQPVRPAAPAVSAPQRRPAVRQPVQRQAAVQPVRPVAPAAPRTAAAAAPVRRAPVTTTGSVPRPATVAPPHPKAGYLVQITAGQNQNEALTAFGKLQRRHPNLLGGYLPNIQKVDLGPKGVWYRVRVGPMRQRTAAVGFCNQLRSVGADCLIRRH